MLKPLKNKVIITVEKDTNKSESGLVLSNEPETDTITGKIVAVSDNCFDILNIGTKCLISKFSGNKIKFENKEYIVVDVDNILAIVEEE